MSSRRQFYFVLLIAWGVLSSRGALAESFNRSGIGLGNAGIFGRSNNNLFNLAGFGRNVDLTFGFPQPVPGFSRLQLPRNINKAVAAQNRDVIVNDPKNGLPIRLVRLLGDGSIISAITDAFGNRISGFSRLGLDTEGYRQAADFFLQNDKIGDLNNYEKILNGQADVNGAIAANLLAAREAGPDASRGIVRIQCDKDVNGSPTDLLAGKPNFSDKDVIDDSYKKLSWQERCIKMVSASLNVMVDPTHPPLFQNQFKVDPNTGILTVSGLRRNFSLRSLGILFNRDANTSLCNSDPFIANPVWSSENLIRRLFDPNVYNLVHGYNSEDVNQNFFLNAGVNFALPRTLWKNLNGAVSHFILDNKESGVAKSDDSRDVWTFKQGGYYTTSTLDTNLGVSGTNVASQQARQTGKNNVGFKQMESMIWDPWGRMHTVLNVAPDEKGKFKIATEAPASAAHGKVAVTSGFGCMACHFSDGVALLTGKGGPYTKTPIAGTTGIEAAQGPLSQIRGKWLQFLQMTGNFVPDSKKPGSALPIPWDAWKNAEKPKSQAAVSTRLGYPPDAVSNLLRSRPEYFAILQADKDGNLNSHNLEAGGNCLIKRVLGDPKRYFATGAPTSTPAPSSASGRKQNPTSVATPHL